MNMFTDIERALRAQPHAIALVNFRTKRSLSSMDLLNMVTNIDDAFSSHLPSEKSIVAISLSNGEDAVP